MIRSTSPYLTFARAAQVLSPDQPPAAGMHPLAVGRARRDGRSLGDGRRLRRRSARAPRVGARTIIHPHVVIGDGTTIGADCILHAHVSIRERCTIGARVILQNGAVVGSDGYGFAQRADGSHEKIPQTGAGGDRRRRRDRRQHDDRSAGGRRDAHQGRHQDRQPGADRSRRGARPQRRCWRRRSASPAAPWSAIDVHVRRPGRGSAAT